MSPRPLVLLLLGALAAAVEYAPTVDQLQLYRWTTTQTTQWSSAGETLRYDSRIAWDLALRCAALDGPRMTLAATFIQVEATHRGPGTDIRVDSASGSGVDDPVLGHLIALVGRTLTLEVERGTGLVGRVGGCEAILAAINQRAPAAIPGDPPPLQAQAQAAWGPEAFAALWSRILALPGQAEPTALPAPFTGGAFTRSWQDAAWSAALADGKPPTFELSKEPVPVRGTVAKLTGSGRVALAAGMPGTISGNLQFTLAIDAMSQPVTTENAVQWTLESR